MFPKDISHPPREWAARFFNVQRWTEMPRGGHFAALEEPELLVDDIRELLPSAAKIRHHGSVIAPGVHPNVCLNAAMYTLTLA